MPKNNNQKVPSAASRLAKLPMVHSACTKLSVLYADTKSSHPHLRSVCEGLESGVTSVVSSVTVKLEPQISIANTIACKSIDWLETTFPVVQAPTEQVVATAKNKMHEIQDVVRLAANGTVDCVQQTVTWLLCRLQQVDDQPLVERAISVASMGLESVLTKSEVLIDRMLPPSEKDEEAAQLLVGFEVATSSSSPARLVSLGAKLYRRIYFMVVENLSSSCLVQSSWQSLAWSIQELPQYMQHQLVSMLFFMFHVYSLNCSPSQDHQPHQDRGSLAAKKSTHKVMLQVHPEATPSACRMRRSNKVTAFDAGCDARGCVYR